MKQLRTILLLLVVLDCLIAVQSAAMWADEPPRQYSGPYRCRIRFQTRATANAALRALQRGEADATLYDEALLRYLANTEFADSIQVLPMSFNEQEYAIALPPDSPLRKPLNGALLRYRASDSWDELVFRYLGE